MSPERLSTSIKDKILMAAFALASAVASHADTPLPEPTEELCATYRQGAVIHRRLRQTSGSYHVSGITSVEDIWYRPEYSASRSLGASLGAAIRQYPDRDRRVQEISELRLIIDIPSGQPLTEEGWSALSSEDTAAGIFITGGWRQEDLANSIAPMTAQLAPVRWELGEAIGHGFFGVFFPDRDLERLNRYAAGLNAFVRLDDNDEVTAVMVCSTPGSTRNPSCRVTFQTALAEVKINLFRTNQLDELGVILNRVEEFVACLPWQGE